jgi:hypothetical protein
LSQALFAITTIGTLNLEQLNFKGTIDEKSNLDSSIKNFKFFIGSTFVVPVVLFGYMMRRVRKIECNGKVVKISNEFNQNRIVDISKVKLSGEVLSVDGLKYHLPHGEYFPTKQAFENKFMRN